MPTLIPANDAAARLGVKPSTLTKMVKRGDLPAPQVEAGTGRHLWPVDAIETAQQERDAAYSQSARKHWLDRFEQARAWWDEHGTWEGADPDLIAWLTTPTTRRRAYQTEALASVDWPQPEVLTEAEQALVDHLHEYVGEHEHALVPQTYISPDGYALGLRVSDLRSRFRDGRVSPLMRRTVEALPEWRWEAKVTMYSLRWRERVAEVEEAMASDDFHGRMSDLPGSLRSWLIRQSQRIDTLSPKDARRLRKVLNKVQPKGVDRLVAAAEKWLAQNPGSTMGDVRVTTTVRTKDGTYHLGKRALYYKRRHAGVEKRSGGETVAPLNEYEIETLEALPGWTWSSRRG